jgi:hypothetical protein
MHFCTIKSTTASNDEAELTAEATSLRMESSSTALRKRLFSVSRSLNLTAASAMAGREAKAPRNFPSIAESVWGGELQKAR